MTRKHLLNPQRESQANGIPNSAESLPPLPLDGNLWRSVARTMQLSEQLARAVELLLRGLCNKQIAKEMGIGECTLDTYFARIGARTGAYGRTAIFRHVLKVSHELRDRAQVSR